MELQDRKTVTVIGGANTDICGRPAAAVLSADSNPGRVSVRMGGVGRNIAHDLCLLGERVRFFTALGDDPFGRSLRQSCIELGMDMSGSPLLPGQSSSVYLYITDETGEMLLAVNDMGITDCLTPACFAPYREDICRSDALVLDGNLPAETLRYLCENVPVPLYADPVSAAKAERLLPVLGRLTCLKPNLAEARRLTGEEEPERCVRSLLARGVKRVILSMGSDGLLAGEGTSLIRQPCAPADFVNCTGAGDAAMAAAVYAGLHGLGLADTARLCALAGAAAVEREETNPPHLREKLGL